MEFKTAQIYFFQRDPRHDRELCITWFLNLSTPQASDIKSTPLAIVGMKLCCSLGVLFSIFNSNWLIQTLMDLANKVTTIVSCATSSLTKVYFLYTDLGI